jgi:DNA-binding NarL/FixJ family response regulator
MAARQRENLNGATSAAFSKKCLDEWPIAVAVVESNAVMRRDLRSRLNRAPGFKCVCACSNGAEALRLIPFHQPQVVLMDIQMPEMSGVDCAARLKSLMPAMHLIIFTVNEDSETVFKALRAGACGYLLKKCSQREILEAIRDALQGGAPMTREIARKVVAAFQSPLPPATVTEKNVLSEREREILDLLARGLSNKEIGAKLDVSQFTVKNHLANIFEKLQVRCRTEAVIAYLQTRDRSMANGNFSSLQT